jgi:hypothetical protein
MADLATTPRPSGAAGWRAALADQLDDLGRWVEGRLVVEPDPSMEVVPAERFLDPGYLRSAIVRAGEGALAQWFQEGTSADQGDHADRADGPDEDEEESGEIGRADQDVDLRLAVSRFTRHYTSSLTAVALVALARGVGLDLSPSNVRLVTWRDLPFRTVLALDDQAVVTCDARPPAWPVEGRSVGTLEELREHVWGRLYAENVAPLFEGVRRITRVSRGVMWTNAAEWVGVVSDAAEEYLGPDEARPFVADRMALLEAPTLPGIEGRNPLSERLDWVPSGEAEYPQQVQTRRTCCGTYLIADRGGRLCQSCPFMPLEDRVALIRERHGVPMGTAGGPAEQRSIELGLGRMTSPA